MIKKLWKQLINCINSEMKMLSNQCGFGVFLFAWQCWLYCVCKEPSASYAKGYRAPWHKFQLEIFQWRIIQLPMWQAFIAVRGLRRSSIWILICQKDLFWRRLLVERLSWWNVTNAAWSNKWKIYIRQQHMTVKTKNNMKPDNDWKNIWLTRSLYRYPIFGTIEEFMEGCEHLWSNLSSP